MDTEDSMDNCDCEDTSDIPEYERDEDDVD